MLYVLRKAILHDDASVNFETCEVVEMITPQALVEAGLYPDE